MNTHSLRPLFPPSFILIAAFCAALFPSSPARAQTASNASQPQPSQQVQPLSPSNNSAPSAVPEAPNPPANGASSSQVSLAELLRQKTTAMPPQHAFHVDLPHSHNPFSPYISSNAPPLDLNNSPRLYSLIRDGKLYVSLRDAISLAIENNLDLAYFRYNFPIAQTDYARTRAGGRVHGVNAGIVQGSTQGGFGSSNAGSSAANSGSAAAGAGGIVTSTLGAGTSVSSFDPYLNFKGYLDHNTTQEGNVFQIGVPTFEQNTIEALANYTQSFALGTSVTVNYLGQRFANNSPYEAINPTLYSNFQLIVTQQLLAGFGLSTNERYIHIAKKNLQITDLAFRAQVVATVTQHERALVAKRIVSSSRRSECSFSVLQT